MVNRTWLREIREARAEGIKTAYEAGETNLTRLAARFDCSRDTIRRSLGVHGIIPNPHRLKKSYLDSQLRRPQAVEHFGMPPNTIPDPEPLANWEKEALLAPLAEKVRALEERVKQLESRMPVFTWTPNTTAVQPYWQTFTVSTAAETNTMASPVTGGVIQVEI